MANQSPPAPTMKKIADILGPAIDKNGGFLYGSAAGLILRDLPGYVAHGFNIATLAKGNMIPGIVWDKVSMGVKRSGGTAAQDGPLTSSPTIFFIIPPFSKNDAIKKKIPGTGLTSIPGPY